MAHNVLPATMRSTGSQGMKLLLTAQVQKLLGAKKAMAFDITAACSGFVVALITAAQFIRTGQYRNILVIGGDALSRFVDWRDRCEPFPPSTPSDRLQRLLLPVICSAPHSQPGWEVAPGMHLGL